MYSAPKKLVRGYVGILPKEGWPGDNTRIRMFGSMNPSNKINTANKSVESCRVPDREKKKKKKNYGGLSSFVIFMCE